MASYSPELTPCGLTPQLIPGRKLTTIDLVGGILCHICKLVLPNKKEFDSHYLTHNTGTEVITYTCVACQITTTSYSSFRGHCYTVHVIKDRFKCNHCNKSFSKLSVLKDHIEVVHQFKCTKPDCKQRFPSQKELHLHQILHKDDTNKPPYQCQTCREEINNIQTCEDHIDLHGIFTYACPLCNENLTKDNATQHLTNHFGDVLNEAKGLDVEETPEDSSINIVGGILCWYCRKLFKNRLEIDTHFVEEHPEKDVLYTCVICHKQYEKYSLYGDHCYYHFSKNRFVCDVCDKTFPRLSLLVAHAHVHRPAPACAPRDVHCRLCKLPLADAWAARRHVPVHRRTHYACPVCARKYAEKYLLMKHAPQHFEAVFHMCKVCGKMFAAKNRLIEHVKVHSSVKNYECKFCGKGFLKPYQLSQHLNVHTGARPYVCVACPKKFASLPNCQKHVKRMHNIDPKTVNKSHIMDSDAPAIKQKSPLKREMKAEIADDLNAEETKRMFELCDEIIGPECIDSSMVETEAQRYETELKLSDHDDTLAELTPILPEDIDKFVSEMLCDVPADIPCEYGPDFGPEDAPLAHVAPQLVVAPPVDPLAGPPTSYPPALLYPPPPQPAWEPPVITKVCSYYGDLDDVAFSFIDTENIF